MQLHGRSLIAGQRASASAAQRLQFHAINPAEGVRLEPAFYEATAGDIEQAVDAAAQAQDTLVTVTPQVRGRFLREIAWAIESLGEELIQRCRAETGLPEARLAGERKRTVNQLVMFAELVEEGSWVDARIDLGRPQRSPVPKPDLRRMLMPIGPIAVFGASNFPLAFSVAGGDTASALAAGNPVIVKAHPCHPGTSELVGEAIRHAAAQAALPPGVFSLLQGAGTHVGTGLVTHPGLRAVGFTGSQRAGLALYTAAAARPTPIPVYAEMGSTNPLFILPGALQSSSAELAAGLAESATLGVGQFCTQPGVVFVLKCPEREPWIEKAGAAIQSRPWGVMLSAQIAEAYETAVSQLEEIDGVNRVSTAGHSPSAPEHRESDGAETTAAVTGRPRAYVTDFKTYVSAPALQAEVFGPSTVFVRVENAHEMLAAARSVEGQLTATIHASTDELREQHALRIALERSAGRVVYNGFPTGVEVCPSMQHGGPYPAATYSQFTSVGSAAILRFARPVCFQNAPEQVLPPALQNANPRNLLRLIDGNPTRTAVTAADP